ncbi:MAG: ChaN family lipoprotein [Oligoflexia bacterium]|nr:ChaN family lipoprotein [Oligoflexia bacterium]
MKFIVLILVSFLSAQAFSWDNKFVDPVSLKKHSLSAVVSSLRLGQVVILAEEHDSKLDHINQVKFLREIANQGMVDSISVAMEFFDYTKQPLVDSFLHGELLEKDFLKEIGWGKNDWTFYKTQVLFPSKHKGRTYAINLPRSVSAKISKSGFESLTDQERELLPHDFQLGNELYRERFYQVMNGGGHTIPEEKLARYFTAQSAWDDTMAARIADAIYENPSQVLVVLVGKFHAMYGGGLIDRLHARGVTDVLNITQFNAAENTWGELYKYIQVDPVYGRVSDLVWVQGEPTDAPKGKPDPESSN